MTFCKDFIHGVNHTGFEIQYAASSRFLFSRLRHGFARALPDSGIVSATVPGYGTGAQIRRIPATYSDDSRSDKADIRRSCPWGHRFRRG